MMRYVLAIALLLPLLAACESMPTWLGGSEKKIHRLPGEREDVLATDPEFAPDERVQAAPFVLPAPMANNAWSQHSGQFVAATSNLSISGDLSDRDSTSVGDGDDFSHTLVPRPVVSGGRVFAMDATGHISAHELAGISNKIWTSEALVHEDELEVMGGGLAVDGDVVYVVSGLGNAAALKADTGEAIWTHNLGMPLRSAPRVADGVMYVVSIDSQLFALDVNSGATLWKHRGIGEVAGLLSNVSPAVAADMVIAPYASGELYALKRNNGDEVWRVSLAQTRKTMATAIFSGIAGDPVVDDAVVFAVSNGGLFSVFNILNGQTLWERNLASINTPWLTGDWLFTINEDNLLVGMLKYDGRIRWTKQLPRFVDEARNLYPIIWRGPVMVDGKLALVSSKGEMILVDAANGEILRTLDVPDNIYTAPIVVDGRVVLINQSAELTVLQ